MKNIKKASLIKIKLTALLFVFAMSCSSPLANLTSSDSTNLSIDLDTSKSVISNLKTVPDSYRISGLNAEGYSFDITTEDTNIQIPDLTPGTWQITVEAFNEMLLIIAEGTGTMEVQPGGYTTITIVLYDVSGTGSLDFLLTWDDALVWNESLDIQLRSLNGDLVDMTFNLESGISEGITENLAAGFYTLEVQLFDDLELVMGAIELIQINEGGTTAIDLDFSEINKPGQKISITEENFTVSWSNSETTADSYKIYYRAHGSSDWIYLSTTASGSVLEYTIDQSILPYGTYDIAVSTVTGSLESELHTSMDDTASPSTGWYIDWQET